MKTTSQARRFVVGVGGGIRKRRRAQGLTQDVLARRLGVDVPTVSRIESGKRDLRCSGLHAVGRALGVPPHVLLEAGGAETSES